MTSTLSPASLCTRSTKSHSVFRLAHRTGGDRLQIVCAQTLGQFLEVPQALNRGIGGRASAAGLPVNQGSEPSALTAVPRRSHETDRREARRQPPNECCSSQYRSPPRGDFAWMTGFHVHHGSAPPCKANRQSFMGVSWTSPPHNRNMLNNMHLCSELQYKESPCASQCERWPGIR